MDERRERRPAGAVRAFSPPVAAEPSPRDEAGSPRVIPTAAVRAASPVGVGRRGAVTTDRTPSAGRPPRRGLDRRRRPAGGVPDGRSGASRARLAGDRTSPRHRR